MCILSYYLYCANFIINGYDFWRNDLAKHTEPRNIKARPRTLSMRSMELNLVHVRITQRDVKIFNFGVLHVSRNGSRNSTPCNSKARLSFEKNTLTHTYIITD